MSKKIIVSVLFLSLLVLVISVGVSFAINDNKIDAEQNSGKESQSANNRTGFLFATPNSRISVDSEIIPVAGNAAQIEGGREVEFRYTLTNSDDAAYSFLTLDTHISREAINFIREIKGAGSLDDNGKNILIPYISLAPRQTLVISFKANVNFSPEDYPIFTEAEIMAGQSGLSRGAGAAETHIAGSAKKNLTIKKNDKFPSAVQSEIISN